MWIPIRTRTGPVAQLPLGVGRGCGGVGAGREGDEERVALGVHLHTPVTDERGPQHLAVLGQHGRIGIAQLVQQPGRAVDVGEEERDLACREGAHAKRILRAKTTRNSRVYSYAVTFASGGDDPASSKGGSHMRRVITIVAVALAVTAAVAIRATTSRAGWHVLSETAINTRHQCVDGVSFTWASGETDTRPPATRPPGQSQWAGPIDLLVQSGPTSLPETENDWFNQPMAGAATFTAGWAPVHNPVLNVWYPYSHTGLVAFRFPLTPSTTEIRIDTQPNGDEATDAFVKVFRASCSGRSTSHRISRRTRLTSGPAAR